MSPEKKVILTTLLLFAGCTAPSEPTPDAGQPADAGTTTVEPVSEKARVKFKGGVLYARTLAAGLQLERASLCKELGLYDCVDEVHGITLSGVEPYVTGIQKRPEQTAVTAPVAAQRIALTACTQRARLDLGAPANAAIFVGLPLDGHRLADLEAPEVAAGIDALYRGVLTRHATASEVQALEDLYRELEAAGADPLAETWIATSCFAVSTTLEALFY